jgi:cytochrome c oxidase cbb3-type subunit 3
MLNSFWNWFVIIVTLVNILACWWLLQWTKGISDRSEDEIGTTGHVWDGDLQEFNNPLPLWWLYSFHITIVFGFIYLALFPGLGNVQGFLGWTQLSQYEAEMDAAETVQEAVFSEYRGMDPEALVASSGAIEIGRRLFSNNCAMCHGSDGRGAVGFPNLTDDNWQWGEGYDAVLTAITNGRTAAMPPLGAALGDNVVAVTAYVQQLSGIKADADMAARGKAQFETICAACHMPDGSGNPALGAPRLNDDIWMYGSDPETIMFGIMNGRSGNMPAHKDILNEDRRRILAAYVLSLSGN